MRRWPIRQYQSRTAVVPTRGSSGFAETVTESRWHQPWSEPKRRVRWYFEHPAFFAPSPYPLPRPPDFGWFSGLSKYPGQKAGLLKNLQLAFVAPPRVLPPVDVTATLAATEVNDDIAEFAVNVYISQPPVRARVSIIEVRANNSGLTSIWEN